MDNIVDTGISTPTAQIVKRLMLAIRGEATPLKLQSYISTTRIENNIIAKNFHFTPGKATIALFCFYTLPEGLITQLSVFLSFYDRSCTCFNVMFVAAKSPQLLRRLVLPNIQLVLTGYYEEEEVCHDNGCYLSPVITVPGLKPKFVKSLYLDVPTVTFAPLVKGKKSTQIASAADQNVIFLNRLPLYLINGFEHPA